MGKFVNNGCSRFVCFLLVQKRFYPPESAFEIYLQRPLLVECEESTRVSSSSLQARSSKSLFLIALSMQRTSNMWNSRLRFSRKYSSQYLPVAPVSSPAPSSRESTRDSSRRPKDSKSRQNEIPTVTKRRSTNNSREAAYDEEEQLRRAIEESKEDTQATAEEASSRRSKRSRSDSET